MKTKIVAVFLAFAVSGMAEDKVPACRLGTDYAVDPNRQLGQREEIVQVSGGIVEIAQRESPHSNVIKYRRCVLPPTGVVVGGTVPWVKVCGNALLQTEGWVLPLAASQKPQVGPAGPIGPAGPQGPQGPVAQAEERPVNVQVNVNVENKMPEKTEIKKKSRWKKLLAIGLVAGGAAAVGGYYGSRGGKKSTPYKNEVVIIRTGP